MSQREYAEDTVFWSLKPAQAFSARRRTITLFLANTSHNAPLSHTWIDNTPDVWTNLRKVLEEQDPKSIAVNVHSDIAFSSGLHAGEAEKIAAELGTHWAKRFVNLPMVAVEFVGTMPKGQLEWYRKLQGQSTIPYFFHTQSNTT